MPLSLPLVPLPATVLMSMEEAAKCSVSNVSIVQRTKRGTKTRSRSGSDLAILRTAPGAAQRAGHLS